MFDQRIHSLCKVASGSRELRLPTEESCLRSVRSMSLYCTHRPRYGRELRSTRLQLLIDLSASPACNKQHTNINSEFGGGLAYFYTEGKCLTSSGSFSVTYTTLLSEGLLKSIHRLLLLLPYDTTAIMGLAQQPRLLRHDSPHRYDTTASIGRQDSLDRYDRVASNAAVLPQNLLCNTTHMEAASALLLR